MAHPTKRGAVEREREREKPQETVSMVWRRNGASGGGGGGLSGAATWTDREEELSKV